MRPTGRAADRVVIRRPIVFLLLSGLMLPNALAAAGGPHSGRVVVGWRPRKLLFYYGYPSLFNGAGGNLERAAAQFDRYDIVVLGAGLEDPAHPQHQAASAVIGLSEAQFYGYVPLTLPIGEVCERIDEWADMGVAGVFLDEGGYDYLAPRLGGILRARMHQVEAVRCARERGLAEALNAWNPADVLASSHGEPPLPLGEGDAVLIESFVYGAGETREEYLWHVDEYARMKVSGGPEYWCLVTTGAASEHENRLVGYDALTYAGEICDAVAVQEDLGEDSTVFYAFAEREGAPGWRRIRGMTLAAYWVGDFDNRTELRIVLERVRGMCLNTIAISPYWATPNLRSTEIRPTEVTVSDDDLRALIRMAKSLGFRVMLKPSLIVETGEWFALLDPVDRDAWFESYRRFLLHYAEIAQEEGVEYLVVEVELSSMVSDERWFGLIDEVRAAYSGLIGYAQPQGGEFNPQEALPVFAEGVDFIGIDAYYPLPSGNLSEIAGAWREIHLRRIEPLGLLFGKPVVFTEIGYRSVVGAADAPWDWRSDLPMSEEEQALLWRAFLVAEEPLVDGFVYWAETSGEWDPSTDKGYSILYKEAELVVRGAACGGQRPRGRPSVYKSRSFGLFPL